MSRRVDWSARRVGLALVELAAIGRIGEPDAAVRMRHDVVGRVEGLAVVIVGDDGRPSRRARSGQRAGVRCSQRDLPALEVERVAVAVVRGHAEHADAPVVLEPAQLAVVRNVAAHEITALSVPGRPLRPQRRRSTAAGSRALGWACIEAWINGEDIRVSEVGGGRPLGPKSRGGLVMVLGGATGPPSAAAAFRDPSAMTPAPAAIAPTSVRRETPPPEF